MKLLIKPLILRTVDCFKVCHQVLVWSGTKRAASIKRFDLVIDSSINSNNNPFKLNTSLDLALNLNQFS